MPIDDGWDWPFLLYVGTITLRRPEKAFWRMTPRKLNALSRAHAAMHSSGKEKEEAEQNTGGFQDAVPGFIDHIF
jgi:uncharacterized phage protein (TIGR02216 family)